MKKWKKRIRLANSQSKEEKKVIREKAEKSETTNDDFVNENFPSLDSIVFLQPKDIVPDLPIHPTVTGYFKNEIPSGFQMRTFVCLSAKNYSYDLVPDNGQGTNWQVTKVKGLSIGSKTWKSEKSGYA